MKIILISCVSKKLSKESKAKNLYISPLFKYNLKYAQSLNPNKVFILSAKYGLLDLETEISPYNQTLNKMSSKEIQKWASSVLKKLKTTSNLNKDEFIFLAGNNYRKYLIPHIKNYKIPLKGLSIGKQLQYLKTQNNCHTLHTLFNPLPKLKFPFNPKEIPQNGIYILFEKGESAHKTDRIVRIGTHTGNNQLPSRLIQHFLNENKDRSIFRKNIGRALLHKVKEPFLEKWELDLTTKKAKQQHSNSINFNKQKEIEKEVTNYIQNNFSFVVFSIEDKKRRLELESKIISTISLCNQCQPSQNWLGLSSPKEKIKKSGLWLVNELYKTPLTKKDMQDLKSYLGA